MTALLGEDEAPPKSDFCLKMGKSRPHFVYFLLFHLDKSVEGMVGTQTQGVRIKGTDESTGSH